MRIFFIVDTHNSALHTSAEQWCEKSGGEVFVATDFRSMEKLLVFLIVEKPDLIIFSWRQVLDVIFLSRKYLKLFDILKNQSYVSALIADHSGDEHSRMLKDKRLADANVALLTVTAMLFDSYESRGLTLSGILPDRPNISLIREIRRESVERVPDSIIWVGNSKWGKRQGYIDHKGLHSLFQPFLAEALQLNPNLRFNIIDSAVKRVSQRDVLRFLASSEVLISTSASEGTGLPVLEALGLGSNVISTNVGIVNKFQAVRVLPEQPTFDDLVLAYKNWELHKIPTSECINEFESYIDSLDTYWDELINKTRTSKLVFRSNYYLLECGYKRQFDLLFWKVKFFLRWARSKYVK